jgi:hypothetical protein
MLGRCAKAEIGGESTQLRWTFVGGLFRLTFFFLHALAFTSPHN